MIPKIILHIVPSLENIGRDQADNLARIAADNPGWQQIIFDDAKSWQFVKDHYPPNVLAALNRIDPAYGPAISDLLRYLILNRLGGVYIDNKSGFTRPLDEIVQPEDECLLVQWGTHEDITFDPEKLHPELSAIAGGEYLNWVMISAPEHPFLTAVIDQVLHNIETYSVKGFGTGKLGVLRTTGPIASSLAIHPLRPYHSHRVIKSTESGIIYTMLGQGKSHVFATNIHYSALSHPVVRLADSAPLLQRLWADLKRALQLKRAKLRQLNRRRVFNRRVRRGKK